MMKVCFNINNTVKVKLNPAGIKIYKDFYKNPYSDYDMYRPDENGYIDIQFWVFMSIFGEHTHIGYEPPFETEILLDLSKNL